MFVKEEADAFILRGSKDVMNAGKDHFFTRSYS